MPEYQFWTLVGMLAAGFAWLIYQNSKTNERVDTILSEISSIKDRLARLEGRFEERGYWESREIRKTGTDDRK